MRSETTERYNVHIWQSDHNFKNKNNLAKSWQDIGQLEFSHTAGGDIDQYSHSGKQFGSFKKKIEVTFHTLQPFYCSVFIQENPRHKNLSMNAPNKQKLETTQVSINR